MEEDFELMNVVTVGGNAVSAFLSWRLQATNACDVTLVWKSGFDHVAQYGISFKSVYSSPVESSPTRCATRPEATGFLPLYSILSVQPTNMRNRIQIISLWQRTV